MTKLTESKRQEKIEAIDTLTDIINDQQLLLEKVDKNNFSYFVSESTGKFLPNEWKNNRMAEIQSGITFLENELNKRKFQIQ